MVFRFWASSSSEAREAPVQFASAQHPGVLALIEDAAATKRGILFATQDQVVVSGLQEPADALVVSRQIQHGMQGFRGKAGTAPVAVSIVIDFNKRSTLLEIKEPNSAVDGQEHDPSSSEKRRHAAEVSHELITLLAIAKPAQVLITHDLLQQIAAIKGLALKSFPGRFGVYEYMWTAEDKLDLLQSEPQLTLAAFPSAPLVVGGTVEHKQGSSPIGAAEIAKQVSGEHKSDTRFALQWPKWVPRPRPLVLGGIGATAIVLISVVGFFSFRGHPSQPVNATSPATAPAHSPGTGNSSPQASASPSTASAPAPAKGTAPTVPSSGAKNVRQKPSAQPPIAAKEKPAPTPTSQPCALPGDIGKYASLAERKREQGDYRSAVRIFRQVLDCDPNNAQARDGLSRAIQAEGQSR